MRLRASLPAARIRARDAFSSRTIAAVRDATRSISNAIVVAATAAPTNAESSRSAASWRIATARRCPSRTSESHRPEPAAGGASSSPSAAIHRRRLRDQNAI